MLHPAESDIGSVTDSLKISHMAAVFGTDADTQLGKGTLLHRCPTTRATHSTDPQSCYVGRATNV
jgi:hypothetical protein